MQKASLTLARGRGRTRGKHAVTHARRLVYPRRTAFNNLSLSLTENVIFSFISRSFLFFSFSLEYSVLMRKLPDNASLKMLLARLVWISAAAKLYLEKPPFFYFFRFFRSFALSKYGLFEATKLNVSSSKRLFSRCSFYLISCREIEMLLEVNLFLYKRILNLFIVEFYSRNISGSIYFMIFQFIFHYPRRKRNISSIVEARNPRVSG